MSYKLIHNENANEYEYHIDGFIAHITYEIRENKYFLTHTVVPKELGGKGIAKMLLIDVLNEIKKTDLKVVGVCSYVIAFSEKNPEWEFLFVK